MSDRTGVPELDKLLDERLPVLDDGFVRVVDYMGSDDSIVQAARVSFGAGTKKVHEDRGLIRFLMRHRHTTPFEMCEIKLHVRVPMDCWRQWIRHRTANVNEYSTRYSIAIDSAQKTRAGEWRKQSAGNKQGSEGMLDKRVGARLTKKEGELHRAIRSAYDERLQHGVAREQARKDLPLSTYTEAYWKIDLHNLFHFLALRMAENAQSEIRQYAGVIGNEIVRRWCPVAWEAFVDYRLEALELSRLEAQLLTVLLADGREAAERAAEKAGLRTGKKNRERDEFEAKLHRLGLIERWRG